MSLDPELKSAWLKALRSGDYPQGTGQLRNSDDEFCCLGVLCDVVEWVTPIEVVWEFSGTGEGYYATVRNMEKPGSNSDRLLLPASLANAVGLNWAPGPEIEIGLLTDAELTEIQGHQPDNTIERTGWVSLAVLNDAGITFERIAQLIEESDL